MTNGGQERTDSAAKRRAAWGECMFVCVDRSNWDIGPENSPTDNLHSVYAKKTRMLSFSEDKTEYMRGLVTFGCHLVRSAPD